MNLEFLENQRANAKQHHRDNPEINRGVKVFPEPLFSVYSASVALHNVYKRIDFHDHLKLHRKIIDIPQHRSCPHTDLQKDIDNGLQIPEKDDNRAGRITECQYKNEHAEAVIKYLQCIQARIIAVQCCHDQ